MQKVSSKRKTKVNEKFQWNFGKLKMYFECSLACGILIKFQN